MAEIDGFADLVSKLSEAEKLLSKMDAHVESLSKNAKAFSDGIGAASSAVGGTGGQKGVGKGGKNVLGQSGGSGAPKGGGEAAKKGLGLSSFTSGPETFSSAVSAKFGAKAGAIAQGLLGSKVGAGAAAGSTAMSFSTLAGQTTERIGTGSFGLSDSLTLFKNLAASSASLLPDITNTMNRATRYYNATTYGGNQMSRGGVQKATFETMRRLNGITSAGSDALVAQFLGARGVPVSEAANSTYQQTLRTVANAGRYLNISNEEAVRSVEGLTNARGAADMLRNFGIYTADLSTGKEKTQTQIFEELAQRLTAGRGKATVEQTQKSIRRGALGVTIDSFFQGDAQGAQMFKQYMIDRAAGTKMDLSANTRATGPAGNENPLIAQMTLAAKQTGAFQNAEKEYIAGIKTATGALAMLTDAAGGLAKLMGGANALIQTLLGNQQFSGAVSGLTSVVDFASKGLSGVFNAARSMNPAGWVEAGLISGTMAATLGAAAGLGVGAELISKTGYSQTGEGSTQGASSMPSGIGLASTIGGKGATSKSADVATSMNMGGDFSGIPGMSTPGSNVTAASPASSTGTGKLIDTSVISKVYPMTAGRNFGQGGHNGIDYYGPLGSEIKAIGAGEVVMADSDPSGMEGKYVRIKHTSSDGKVVYSGYAHLNEVLVSKGQTVSKGQVIGRMGTTGNSTGVHLHLEMTKSATGWSNMIDPNGAEVAALLGGDGDGGGGAQAALEFGLRTETLQAGMAFTKKLAQMPTAAVNAFNTLKGLYSGDQAQILSSIQGIAQNMSISPEEVTRYISASDVSTVSPSGAISNPVAPGNAVNNNVSITVQVPDVTSADALKFAQLVRAYLQNDSLMSTTGSV